MAFIRSSRSPWHPDSGLQLPSSEITPQEVYASRRTWLAQAALGSAVVGLAVGGVLAGVMHLWHHRKGAASH